MLPAFSSSQGCQQQRNSSAGCTSPPVLTAAIPLCAPQHVPRAWDQDGDSWLGKGTAKKDQGITADEIVMQSGCKNGSSPGTHTRQHQQGAPCYFPLVNPATKTKQLQCCAHCCPTQVKKKWWKLKRSLKIIKCLEVLGWKIGENDTERKGEQRGRRNNL